MQIDTDHDVFFFLQSLSSYQAESHFFCDCDCFMWTFIAQTRMIIWMRFPSRSSYLHVGVHRPDTLLFIGTDFYHFAQFKYVQVGLRE